MSEHIHNLEVSLQCKLFDRLGRSILPTKEAEILYSGAKKILADIAILREEISHSNNTVAGTLTIGASSIPGTCFLPTQAANFRKKYPGISFEICINDSMTIIHKIADNELSLGIVGTNPQNPKLHYTPFAEDQLVLAASPDYTGAKKITAEKICSLPLIQREQGSGTRKSYEIILKKVGISPQQLNICATFGSSSAVKEAVKANLGLAILSRHAIAEDLARGSLLEIPLTNLSMPRSFFIVTPARRELARAYQLFYEQLRENKCA